MFTRHWQIFRLLGIPVSLDASWLIILALITVTLTGVFQSEVPNLPPFAYGLIGLTTALAYFACIILHEFGHAIVAKLLGTRIRGIISDALDALRKMQGVGTTRLLVMDHDHLVGVVSIKDLLDFLNLKLELDNRFTEL